MGTLEHLEQRMTDNEQEMRRVDRRVDKARKDAAAARGLAAHAHADVADFREHLRGQTRLIQAIRQTQVEHHVELTAGITGLRTDIAELQAGQNDLVSEIGTLKSDMTEVKSDITLLKS